jgi:hypothetical protein
MIPCPWCDSLGGMLLGMLGVLLRFRCRDCGGEFWKRGDA